ncbi:heterokaryon incompatibility protein-domain-containing protein [Annulohypoxylon bovei var. microspora]|nr:heterokaryon incompatibility protein-domain-containing protein [Annulohypoxylon bovei var. microspora]
MSYTNYTKGLSVVGVVVPSTVDKVQVSLSYQWYPPYSNPTLGSRPVGLKSLVARLLWTTKNDAHSNLWTWLHFGIDSPPNRCAKCLRLETSPQDQALCPENLSMIRSQLKGGKKAQPATNTAYPTRLIHIEKSGRSLSCRLVETSSDTFKESGQVSYAALSYCWGSQDDSAKQFKTEKETLSSRLGGFALLKKDSSILYDAIRTTLALGIRYLWVDAVCIIQDDLEDWQKESSRMSVVFQNAVVTICTPASTSCRQGFLSRDRVTTIIKFQSKISENVYGPYIVRLIGEIEELHHAAVDCFRFSRWYSVWAQRGWVFQEYELSQRALIFGRTKLHIITGDGLQSETNGALQLRR